MNRSNIVRLIVASAIGISVCNIANASDLDIQLFGQKVSIAKGPDDQEILKIGDREVHKNYYVSIDEIQIVDGIPTAIGNSSAGGNACEGSPFMVSFPSGKPPRIDGPLDSCLPVKATVSERNIHFSTMPLPNAPGKNWVWTPVSGFKEVEAEAFVADKSKGWDQLRERSETHPSSLLQNAEVSAEINRLAGPDKALVNDILFGVGSGEFKGDLFVGITCSRHMCLDQEALVVADLQSKTVYLAWKPSGQKIKVSPVVKSWPEKAKAELREWSAKWK